MTFEYSDRKAMTVLPPEVDEATGQPIGEAEVYDNEHKHPFFRNEQELHETDPDVDESALHPSDRQPPLEIRLADTFEEINTTSYDISDEFANTIASVDIGNSPEAITVQYLATQVYKGSMTAEEAFQQAVSSGYDPDALMMNYYALQHKLNG